MLVKVCGARSAPEVERIAGSGANLVGLWHGVPGAVPTRQVAALATAAPSGLQPVLVTFLDAVQPLRTAISETGVRWLQLHGFQQPAVVRAVKADPSITVIKVLHVDDTECAEQPLIPAYERAGADLFLIDHMPDRDRLGSTGSRPPTALVLRVAERLRRPFLLAGGITALLDEDHHRIAEHPLFAGVDVDTAVRDERGGISRTRCAEIAQAWRSLREAASCPSSTH